MGIPHGRYDASDFLFPSYDPDGRSIRIYIQVPLSLSQAIDGVRESRKFPLETIDDVVIYCLHKGIETLRSMEPCVSVGQLLDATVSLFRENLELKRFQEFFAKLDGVIFHLLRSGYQSESARRLVKAVEEIVLTIPSGRYRCWALRELRQRWGQLLTSSAEQAAEEEGEGRRGEQE